MKPFYAVLANSLAASLTNNFVWFAVTFWVYLETQSVVATSVMAGVYTGTVALTGFFLGSLVDRYKKKTAMILSSVGSLLLYAVAFIIYIVTPKSVFANPSSPVLWTFIVLALIGALLGNFRTIALSTLVTILIPESERDKANGLVGTTNGVGFLISSIFSGLIIGFLGIFWMQILAIGLTLLALIHVWTIYIPEEGIAHADDATQRIDIRGTISALQATPGLFALIFFNTFNNFLGGVFMALMDAYGLALVTVQTWGLLWGLLSLGFIFGGLIVSKKGLGKQPLRTLFLANIAMWITCIFFPLQASIIPLALGMFAYLCLIPVVEAAEQTIVQKLIPPERQGRVFGFAQSVEEAASPLTAFMISPIAQYIFIPFMTTGAGVNLIGGWFGTGKDRGIALVFTLAGLIGLIVTIIAMRSSAYKTLLTNYDKQVEPQVVNAE